MVHHGHAPWFAPVHDASLIQAVRARHGLDAPYFLFIGTLQPRKNLERLLAAFDRVAADRPDLLLALVGAGRLAAGPAPGGARHSSRARPGAPARVRRRRRPAAAPVGLARAGVPVALRGVRPARPRSDGLRHAGPDLEHLVAARRSSGTPRCWSIRSTSAPSPTASRTLADDADASPRSRRVRARARRRLHLAARRHRDAGRPSRRPRRTSKVDPDLTSVGAAAIPSLRSELAEGAGSGRPGWPLSRP